MVQVSYTSRINRNIDIHTVVLTTVQVAFLVSVYEDSSMGCGY